MRLGIKSLNLEDMHNRISEEGTASMTVVLMVAEVSSNRLPMLLQNQQETRLSKIKLLVRLMGRRPGGEEREVPLMLT